MRMPSNRGPSSLSLVAALRDDSRTRSKRIILARSGAIPLRPVELMLTNAATLPEPSMVSKASTPALGYTCVGYSVACDARRSKTCPSSLGDWMSSVSRD